MKNIILITLIFIAFACKAQSPIIDINADDIDLTDGAYLKDVNNLLNKYEGTWLLTDGNTSLTITFQKKTQVYNDSWYEDLLVGEYKYIENGVEKVNTLSNLGSLTDLYDHNLTGCLIISKNQFPGCSNCNANEKLVQIDFSDPDPAVEYLNGSMYMGLRYIDELTPKLQINFAKKGTFILPEGAPLEPSLPFGTYTLTKQ